MEKNTFVNLYKKTLIDPPIYPGAIITTKVTDINNNFVTVNGFIKSDGYIPTSHFKNEKGICEVKIGSNVEVIIESVEDITGEIKLSREKAKKIRAWEELENVYKYEKTIIGFITAKVKGGFTVKLNTLKAFLPGSLIAFRSTLELDEIKGKEFRFKIIKLEKKKNNIVVSQKFMVEKSSGEIIQNIITRLKEGSIVKGIIKNITDYGAFIDLGGIDGLLHITDMSWKRIKHPSHLVSIGSEIKIKILKFDKNTNRVSLGLKQLSKDPWDDIKKKYKENMTVNGTVTNITDYGCFVEIEEGIEGLVHLSEMDWTNKNINPKKVVKQGMKLKIIILDINTEKRRISLGLKQNSQNPWHIFNKNNKIGNKIKGKIKNITDYGVFIELQENLDGLLHVSDISWNKTKSTSILKTMKKNKIIETIILSVDQYRERITLGLKQLRKNPIIKYLNKIKKNEIIKSKIINNNKDIITTKISNNIYGKIPLKESKNKNFSKILKTKINKINKKEKILYLDLINKSKYYKKIKNISKNKTIINFNLTY